MEQKQEGFVHMKYYEVIYNSSQHTRNEGVGFGIRTATEGIPEEYLKVVEENEIFSYDPGDIHPVSPKALLEHPEEIRKMPRGYSYTRIPFSPGNDLYVLTRKIAVGFDYTYYLSYQAGRLGNYVAHCFIFPEKPAKEVFEILYEQPAGSSCRFLPESPVPSPGNEGMKALSLGEYPPLPAEERSFRSLDRSSLSGEAIDILFGYIEAKNLGKPLTVRLEDSRTASVIADLYRLLPSSMASDITFYTNHQEEGINKRYDILFLNQYYPFEVSKRQSYFLDFLEGVIPETKESKNFRSPIEQHMEHHQWQEIYEILEWVLSDGYQLVREKSPETNQQFYQYYCLNNSLGTAPCETLEDVYERLSETGPETSFTLDLLKENEELKEVLSRYVRLDKPNGNYLFCLASKLFMDCREEIAGWIEAIAYMQLLEEAGMYMRKVIVQVAPLLTERMLRNEKEFSLFIEKAGLLLLKSYFDKTQFFLKTDFLYTKEILPYFTELYTFFYINPPEALEIIVRNLLSTNLKKEELERLFNMIEPDEETRLQTYVSILIRTPEYFNLLWPFVKELSAGAGLRNVFAEQETNPLFAPLFYHEVRTPNFAGNKVVYRLRYMAHLMGQNKAFRNLVVTNFKQDNLYGLLFRDLKKELSADKVTQLTDEIPELVTEIFRKEKGCDISDWIILQNLLAGTTEECTAKNVVRYWHLAKELKRTKFLYQLIPLFLTSVKDEKEIEGFMKDMFDYFKLDEVIVIEKLENPKIHLSKSTKVIYYKYLFQIQDTSIPDIQDRLKLLKYSLKEREKFLKTHFNAKWTAYKMNQGVKKVIRQVFSFFKKN